MKIERTVDHKLKASIYDAELDRVDSQEFESHELELAYHWCELKFNQLSM